MRPPLLEFVKPQLSNSQCCVYSSEIFSVVMTKKWLSCTHDEGGASWQFVNLSVPQNAKNEAQRRIVRSNAARRHQKSWRSPKRHSIPDDPIHHVPVQSFRVVLKPSNDSASDYPGNRHDVNQVQLWPDALDQSPVETRGSTINVSAVTTLGLLTKNGSCVLRPREPSTRSTSVNGPNCVLGSGNLEPFASFPGLDSFQNSELVASCKFPKLRPRFLPYS